MLEAGPPHFETRRIALWAVPRSVSSAFERSFIERDDTRVLHEPFAHAYYHGPDRRSDRFNEDQPRAEHGYRRLAQQVLQTADAPILFVKDMAYQVMPVAEPVFLGQLTNTFLIRHPGEALASFHRMWPDLMEEEAGYAAQARLFEVVTAQLQQPAIVVDATDFRNAPDEIMRAYCEAIGVPFFDGALSWESGPVEAFEPWSEWHREVEQSSGIRPPGDRAPERLPERIQRLIESCLPHYDRLFQHRLKPQGAAAPGNAGKRGGSGA